MTYVAVYWNKRRAANTLRGTFKLFRDTYGQNPKYIFTPNEISKARNRYNKSFTKNELLRAKQRVIRAQMLLVKV